MSANDDQASIELEGRHSNAEGEIRDALKQAKREQAPALEEQDEASTDGEDS